MPQILKPRTVKYIDKDRFFPWLDVEIKKSFGKTNEKLAEIKKLCEEGRFDWQPAE